MSGTQATQLPRVSALVTVYNRERYVERAILSALEQDYPPELIEVVVVDDGSTDHSVAVVEELVARHPQREIRFVKQAHTGHPESMNTALATAGGDILGFLDADDEWLPGKLRRTVDLLLARPETGLVFSDMARVGPDDSQLGALLAQDGKPWQPPSERAFPLLLVGNFATGSSMVFRASLRHVFEPIPTAAPYADWWLALSVARVGEVAFVPEQLARYRIHDSNICGGVAGTGSLEGWRKELEFQRWCLTNLPLDSLDAREAAGVWCAIETKARAVARAAGSQFDMFAPADPASSDQAAALALEQPDDPHEEARLMLRVLALDPDALRPRERLMQAATTATAPDPLAGARRFVTLIDAEELLGNDSLLSAYAVGMAGLTNATLAIDASRMDGDLAVAELQAMLQRCGLVGRPDVHLLAVVGEMGESQRQRMLARVGARYCAQQTPPHSQPPVALCVTPATLNALHALAA